VIGCWRKLRGKKSEHSAPSQILDLILSIPTTTAYFYIRKEGKIYRIIVLSLVWLSIGQTKVEGHRNRVMKEIFVPEREEVK
jgi:hypothetical protein